MVFNRIGELTEDLHEMINILNKIVNALLSLLLIAAVIMVILLFGVRIFSITPYVVTSGSMDPVYPVGSVVYVEDIEPEKLEAGDDISFYLDENVVATHRIREVYPEECKVQTYGINNFDSDGNQINDARAIEFDEIIGKVKFSIPIIGFAYMFIKTIYGKIAIIIVAFSLFVISKALNHLEREKET